MCNEVAKLEDIFSEYATYLKQKMHEKYNFKSCILFEFQND
jgi:hypothetical protein